MFNLRKEDGGMKTNDYVKFLTQTAVKYAQQPKDERNQLKLERKASKPGFMFRWFGIIPFGIKQLLGKTKKQG